MTTGTGARGGPASPAGRVVLTAVTESDLPELHRWINDRDLVLLSAPFRPVSPAEHRAWFEGLRGRPDLVLCAVRDRETQALFGTCQLHSIHAVHRTAELQIRLAPEARGQGVGTEAVRRLLDFGFRDLNLHRVYLHVLATNAAAMRVYEKVGFAREGVLREAAHIDGRYVDVVVMGILREEHAS